MMKRTLTLLTLMLVLSGFTSSLANAGISICFFGECKTRSMFDGGASGEVDLLPEPPKYDLQVLPNFNLQGDSAYLFSSKAFAVGAGSDLILWKDGSAALRANWLTTVNEKGAQDAAARSIIGGSLIFDLKKVAGLSGGNWVAKALAPRVGPFVGRDFNNEKWEYGILISVVNLVF